MRTSDLFLFVAVSLVSAKNHAAPIKIDKNGATIDGSVLVESYNHAPSTVLAIWEKDLVSGNSATSLWDPDFTSLTSYSCGDHLLSNEAGLDVFFDANEKGAGTVKVNDMAHLITLEPAESGGIACSRIYGEEHVAVHCYLPLSSTLKERDIPTIMGNSTGECFDGSLQPEHLSGILPAGDDSLSSDEPTFYTGSEDSASQRVAGYDYTKKEGNGNPKKWRFHKVLSQMHCGTAKNCEASFSSGTEITHTAGFSIGGMGSAEWISGGYSVSYTKSSTRGYTCAGEKNQYVCVKNVRNYQEYTVHRWAYDDMLGHYKYGKAFEIWSPMTVIPKDHVYCAINACPGEGVTGWGDNGRGTW